MSGTTQDTDESGSPLGVASEPISITAPDQDSRLIIKKTVSDEVLAQVKEYTTRTLRYLLFVVAGAIIASVWNLNGQIYQAVGATSVSTKALELEIARLKDEVSNRQQQLTIRDCLDNKKVTDKAGCYRGN